MADRFVFDFFCARDVDDQAIIVKEFFARANVPQGFDENTAAVVFDRFAIWIAGVIDPTRFIPADGGIDHFCFVVEPKIVGPRIVQFLRNIRPQNTASGVLDDERAFADGPGGENTAAVHRRFAHFQIFRDAVLRIGGARSGSILLLFSLGHKMNSKFVRKAEGKK